MTDLLERRLCSAMSRPDNGKSGDTGSSDLERWSLIEAAAQRRRDRSDLGQRAAMIASVFLVAGSALALGSGSLLGWTETGSVGGVEAQEELSSSRTALQWLAALGLTVAIGNGVVALWRRIPDWYFAFQPPSIGRWGRVAGTLIVATGFVLPLLAMISFMLEDNNSSSPGSVRLILPLATVAGSLLVALGSFLTWRGTSVGSWLGTLLLTASAIQTGVALRALFRVKVLFEQFEPTISDPRPNLEFDSLDVFQTQVEDAGNDLYPFGSASLIFLLVPWIAGCILVFGPRSRARAWSISLGVAVTVATYVTFHSLDSDFMSLID